MGRAGLIATDVAIGNAPFWVVGSLESLLCEGGVGGFWPQPPRMIGTVPRLSTNIKYVVTVRGSQLIGAQPLGCRDVRSFCAPRIFYACPTCEAAETFRSFCAPRIFYACPACEAA